MGVCLRHGNGLINKAIMGKKEGLFEVFKTGDGSPTLSLGGGEKMHSMEGALSESLYVYGESLKEASLRKEPLEILSMGLGLGYNEWISLAHLASVSPSPPLRRLSSFEAQGFLVDSLKGWLKEEAILEPLAFCYEQVVKLVAWHFKLSPSGLKAMGQAHEREGLWQLKGALPEKNKTGGKFNLIFYDAFSSNTDPELWTQDYIQGFLGEYGDPRNCFFATYGATGALKRALRHGRFHLGTRAGFGKKRESTLAYRSHKV